MIISATLLCLIIYFTNVPLGIVKDWTWGRHVTSIFPVYELAAISIFFIISVVIAYKAGRYAKSVNEAIICILLILGCGAFIDYYILQSGKFGLNENIFGVLDKYTGGYMTEAANIKEPGQYFRSFHVKLSKDEDKSNHVDVHPPGNIMLSYAVLQWCRRSKVPDKILHAVLPGAIFEELDTARKDGVFNGVPDENAVFTAGAFMVLISLICLTLARLLIIAASLALCRQCGNFGLTALLTATAVPAPILFLGHYDVLMFFLGAICCFLFSLGENSKRGYWWDIATGIALGCAVLFSLAFSGMILFVIACVGISRPMDRRNWYRIAAVTGGGLAVVALCYLCGIHIIEICYYASRNNSRYFAESGRSMFWPPFNILDYLIFGGVFLFFMPLNEISRIKLKNPCRFKIYIFYFSVLLLLFISPFSRGEMGRLLLFFMPAGLMLSLAAVARKKLDNASWWMFTSVAAISLLLTFLIRIILKLIMIL